MKLILTSVFLTATLLGISAAQDSTPNGTTAPQAQNPTPSQASPSSPGQPGTNVNIKLAPGSVIPVQLTKSIDAKKAKTGDEVDAEVTADLKAENGDIVVPKNTKVVGRVTEAQARSKEQKESQVGIAFDHAVMKNGSDMALPMSIQAVVAQSYLSGGNSGASNQSTAQPSQSPASGGMSQGGYGSRSGGMGSSQAAAPQTPQAPSGDAPAPSANAHQPITGKTEGVLGIPNLTLSTMADSAHGSVMSSEKNNVKLEGGTLLLLRVN
jgi:hypothetical protein